MADPARSPIPPQLMDMAQKVWAAQTSDRAAGSSDRGRPGYYRAVWNLFIGPRAFAVLVTVPNSHRMVVVGYHTATGSERQTGRLDRWEVMGIPVTEDPQGPLDMWRLADSDGTTLAWGELTP